MLVSTSGAEYTCKIKYKAICMQLVSFVVNIEVKNLMIFMFSSGAIITSGRPNRLMFMVACLHAIII